MEKKDKIKAAIWRKNRNAVAKKPATRRNMWDAMKDQLIDQAAKLDYHAQTEPTQKMAMEYKAYWELIKLCTDNQQNNFVG